MPGRGNRAQCQFHGQSSSSLLFSEASFGPPRTVSKSERTRGNLAQSSSSASRHPLRRVAVRLTGGRAWRRPNLRSRSALDTRGCRKICASIHVNVEVIDRCTQSALSSSVSQFTTARRTKERVMNTGDPRRQVASVERQRRRSGASSLDDEPRSGQWQRREARRPAQERYAATHGNGPSRKWIRSWRGRRCRSRSRRRSRQGFVFADRRPDPRRRFSSAARGHRLTIESPFVSRRLMAGARDVGAVP
jgi:hypothetical protein